VTTDPRDLGPDTGPMRIESLRKTYSLGSGGAAKPKKFGSSLMPQSSNLGEAPLSCLKGDFLIIIIIIEFSLQINSMFFL